MPEREHADVIAHAFAYVRALAAQLDATFADYGFEVVMTVGDSCIVRFYRRRADEPPWLLPDLEAYADEALLVLAVD